MKKAIIGNSKGYIIPKKEMDDKLKEIIPELKGKKIMSISDNYNTIRIIYYDEEIKVLEKVNEYSMKITNKKTNVIYLTYDKFKSTFNIEEEGFYITLRTKKDENLFTDIDEDLIELYEEKGKELFYIIEKSDSWRDIIITST